MAKAFSASQALIPKLVLAAFLLAELDDDDEPELDPELELEPELDPELDPELELEPELEPELESESELELELELCLCFLAMAVPARRAEVKKRVVVNFIWELLGPTSRLSRPFYTHYTQFPTFGKLHFESPAWSVLIGRRGDLMNCLATFGKLQDKLGSG
jgi:hypothetical protein